MQSSSNVIFLNNGACHTCPYFEQCNLPYQFFSLGNDKILLLLFFVWCNLPSSTFIVIMQSSSSVSFFRIMMFATPVLVLSDVIFPTSFFSLGDDKILLLLFFVWCNLPSSAFIRVRKRAKIRNLYNQAPHLTQDTNGKITTSQLYITYESQEVSPFTAGDHKASILGCVHIYIIWKNGSFRKRVNLQY